MDLLFNSIGAPTNDPSRFEAANGFNGETTTAPQSSRSRIRDDAAKTGAGMACSHG